MGQREEKQIKNPCFRGKQKQRMFVQGKKRKMGHRSNQSTSPFSLSLTPSKTHALSYTHAHSDAHAHSIFTL